MRRDATLQIHTDKHSDAADGASQHTIKKHDHSIEQKEIEESWIEQKKATTAPNSNETGCLLIVGSGSCCKYTYAQILVSKEKCIHWNI